MKSMNFNEEGNFITLRELPAGMAYLGAVKLEHNLWVAIKEIDFPRWRLEYRRADVPLTPPQSNLSQFNLAILESVLELLAMQPPFRE